MHNRSFFPNHLLFSHPLADLLNEKHKVFIDKSARVERVYACRTYYTIILCGFSFERYVIGNCRANWIELLVTSLRLLFTASEKTGFWEPYRFFQRHPHFFAVIAYSLKLVH